MRESQIILLAEGEYVRWWSSTTTGILKRNLQEIVNLESLRTGETILELSSAIEQEPESEFIQDLNKQVQNSNHKVRLRIIDNFSNSYGRSDWNKIPFEWLSLNRTPLIHHVLVERYVPKENCLEPATTSNETVNIIMRLPSADEKIFNESYGYRAKEIKINPSKTYRLGLNHRSEEWNHWSAMVVICHGTEDGNDEPFKVPGSDEAWKLPDRLMPPLIILLVCGDDNGNLVTYARDKLLGNSDVKHNGVKTVIAPIGKLGIEAAANFLVDFLKEWPQGKPINEILHDAQLSAAKENADHKRDVRRLCILGRGELAIDTEQHPESGYSLNQLSTKNLVEKTKEETKNDSAPKALAALIERIILQCQLEKIKDEAYKILPEKALRQSLGLDSLEKIFPLMVKCLPENQGNNSEHIQISQVAEAFIRSILNSEGNQHSFNIDESFQGILYYFPKIGTLVRVNPKFRIEELPTPLAIAWKNVNLQMDKQDVVETSISLKIAFRDTIRFISSIAVMDILNAQDSSIKVEKEKQKLINNIFSATDMQPINIWIYNLFSALKIKTNDRKVDKFPDIFVTKSTENQIIWETILTGEDFKNWQNTPQASNKDVNDLLKWWNILRELIWQASEALNGWELRDQNRTSGTLWHGLRVLETTDHHHVTNGDFSPLALVNNKSGQVLDLIPLVSIQYCQNCGQGLVFSYRGRPNNHLDEGKFQEFQEKHSQKHKNLDALKKYIQLTEIQTANEINDAAVRALEEYKLFSKFDSKVKPDYLIKMLNQEKHKLSEGKGYVYISGPEGCGKSWFVKSLVEDSHDSSKEAMLLCRLDSESTQNPDMFLSHLRQQAKDQKLSNFDLAFRQSSEMSKKSEQLKTFLQCLRESNSDRDLNLILDELDELPEPEKRINIYASSSKIADFQEEVLAETILDFLPNENELPKRCYILLVSRPQLSQHATKKIQQIESSGSLGRISLDPTSAGNLALVETYVKQYLDKPALVPKVIELSNGIFLYADHYVQALLQGAFSDDLPEPGEFYNAYLKKMLTDVGRKVYETAYLRVLLLLAAAAESVSKTQLESWGVENRYINEALLTLRAFFTEQYAYSETSPSVYLIPELRYAHKHAAFLRYLDANPEMSQLLVQTHQQIIESSLKILCSGQEIDPTNSEYWYAVKHLPYHCSKVGKVRRLSDIELKNYHNAFCVLAGVILQAEKFNPSLSSLIDTYLFLLRTLNNPAQISAVTSSFNDFVIHVRQHSKTVHDFNYLLSKVLHTHAYKLSRTEQWDKAIHAYSELISVYRTRIDEEEITSLETSVDNEYFQELDEEDIVQDYVYRKLPENPYVDRKFPEYKPFYKTLKEMHYQLGFAIICLEDTYRRAERFDEITKLITLCKTLISEGKHEIRATLAKIMHSQANYHIIAKQWDEGIHAYREEIFLLEELVKEGQLKKRSGLALAFSSLGLNFFVLERWDDAIQAYIKQISLYQTLVDEGQLDMRSDLARALELLAIVYIHDKRWDEIGQPIIKSMSIYKTLINEGHLEVRVRFANTVALLALSYSETERLDEAIKTMKKCLNICKEVFLENYKLNEYSKSIEDNKDLIYNYKLYRQRLNHWRIKHIKMKIRKTFNFFGST